jgi:hypothetical protein
VECPQFRAEVNTYLSTKKVTDLFTATQKINLFPFRRRESVRATAHPPPGTASRRSATRNADAQEKKLPQDVPDRLAVFETELGALLL